MQGASDSRLKYKKDQNQQRNLSQTRLQLLWPPISSSTNLKRIHQILRESQLRAGGIIPNSSMRNLEEIKTQMSLESPNCIVFTKEVYILNPTRNLHDPILCIIHKPETSIENINMQIRRDQTPVGVLIPDRLVGIQVKVIHLNPVDKKMPIWVPEFPYEGHIIEYTVNRLVPPELVDAEIPQVGKSQAILATPFRIDSEFQSVVE